MEKTKKLIIFGDSSFAEIAYEYFTYDSDYKVVAFTVSKEYLKQKTKFGLPVIPFETLERKYSPKNHYIYVALVYNVLNRVREQFYNLAKEKGYRLANYISSCAFVWKNVTLGDNVFIFEDNTVQPFVKLGSNIILWSGNHIGHHSTIGDHCFISSQVVISGHCNIGKNSFLGVNATVINNINVGKDCLIGANTLIVKNTEVGKLFKGISSKPDEISIYEKFNIKQK